jgi:hypothetical protein
LLTEISDSTGLPSEFGKKEPRQLKTKALMEDRMYAVEAQQVQAEGAEVQQGRVEGSEGSKNQDLAEECTKEKTSKLREADRTGTNINHPH